MSTINYSKWDHIEVSDDEDDIHPNIDTGSLFRWRHQARVERMEQQKQKKEEITQEKQSYQSRRNEMKQKIKAAEDKPADLEKLKIELSELELQEKQFLQKEEELKQEEKLTPWNIDTICHEGMSKTVINKPKPPPKEETDEEKAEKQRTFTNKYKDQIKKYGMTRRYEDSQLYLTENPHLVCDETCNYLVLWCVDLVIEEKKDLMEHVSHQVIVMQFILELAKSLERDPRSCVAAFFSRIKLGERQYMDAFNDELEAFRERVRTRAQARIDEAVQEYEEEEKKKRLGPGGLDPLEVLESLPDSMKECFESKDIDKLKKIIVELPQEEAEHHMKRCIDSGLWVPNAADVEGEQTKNDANGVEEEETYEDVD